MPKMADISDENPDSKEILNPFEPMSIEKHKFNMLQRLANSDAHFKSQQRGEPDLLFDEKRKIAAEILDTNPSLFLFRFYKHLSQDDLPCFQNLRDNYEVEFYLKQIVNNTDQRKRGIQIKNRRYEAMKQLVSKGEYFSDVEMRKRSPLLFEQMVGKYLTKDEKEKLDAIDQTDLKFSTILMEHMERGFTEQLRKKQQEEEEAQFEESEDEDSDDDAIEDDKDEESEDDDDSEEEDENNTTPIDHEEKELMRSEFVRSMHQSFLLGKDEEFDYSAIDDNEAYDAVDKDGDEEEKYFDSEEPEYVHTPLMDQT